MASGIRRELRKLHPGLKVAEDEILAILETEALKREVIESNTANRRYSIRLVVPVR